MLWKFLLLNNLGIIMDRTGERPILVCCVSFWPKLSLDLVNTHLYQWAEGRGCWLFADVITRGKDSGAPVEKQGQAAHCTLCDSLPEALEREPEAGGGGGGPQERLGVKRHLTWPLKCRRDLDR